MSPFNPGTANLAPIMSTGLQEQSQFDPVGHTISLRDVLAQTAQRQAETGLVSAEAQQRQRDLQNAALIRTNLPGLLDSSKGQYDDTVRQGLMKAGVDPEAVEKVIGAKFSNDEAVARTQELQSAAQNAQQQAAKATADLQNQARLHGSALAYKIQQSGYDPSVATAAITDLEKSDTNWAKTGAGQQMLQLMSQDPNGFKAKIDSMVANPDFQAQQAGIESTKAETKRTQAQTTVFEQQAAQTKASLEAMQQFLQNPKATLGAGGAIDQIIDPKKYADLNARTKARVQAAYAMPGTIQDKVSAVKEAIQQGSAAIDRIEEQTNPAVRQAKIADDVSRAVQTQKAIAAMTPDALAAVTNPQLRQQASTNFEKASNDYADKVGAARQLGDLIDQAQSGNKAAPGIIPIATVRGYLNRVNSQELRSVSDSSGNAYDRVQGFLDKYTEGQPIPPAVLKDLKTIATGMETAASRTYNFKVQVNNRTTGSKFQPITLEDASAPAARPRTAKPAYTKGQSVMYQGKAHTIQDITPEGKLVLSP